MRHYAHNEMASSLQEADYYYDSHSTAEDLMGETSFHIDLIHYLTEVLRWLFREQVCAIYRDLNFYHTLELKEWPVIPDIAVIKGVPYAPRRSWTVGKTGPAPQVVFEIASKETWRIDLKEKPLIYARLGVQEYFLYDPETPPHLKHMGKKRRLIGWQRNHLTGAMEEMQPDLAGRLWSTQLDSFLVPDGLFLRLYDSNYQRRLTQAEANEQSKQLAEQKAWLAEQSKQLAEQKAQLAEQRARILEEKLRSLGMNPDEL